MKTVGRKLVAGLMTLALALTATLSIGAANVRAADNGQEMWRLYNPNSGEHFYTANGAERNNLISAGWNYEGAGFIASGSTPVYRMYNANVGDHHYTTNSAEKDMLVSVGWQYEGIGWNTESNGFSVYRLYNPNAVTATHHYTLDEAEKNHLVSIGWKYEGISWNSLHMIRTENIKQSTCASAGYSGDVVCQDVHLTYDGEELPANNNHHLTFHPAEYYSEYDDHATEYKCTECNVTGYGTSWACEHLMQVHPEKYVAFMADMESETSREQFGKVGVVETGNMGGITSYIIKDAYYSCDVCGKTSKDGITWH